MSYMIYIGHYGQDRMVGQADRQKFLSPALCRAARGFLDWTQSELANRSGVSRGTIRDYEGERHSVHRATEAQLRLAFENGGIAFVCLEGDTVGICPRSSPDSEKPAE
ncbi:helix-turn-helix transcriptional regulator [Rhizobium cremeum]|uniref:helix-turn-helix domain-containing protein n=1 Tax=Rhizobium cremeum TaxID=2813827 RepID=UPI001FD19651|nr:helix-turn-helix transcriptional regulator [Rhizobium cremeum]MCJ7995326.1 helix-turn-helix transcriptional regulator [Rhizobium cremeum]MCJ8000825.1 helix-turn-helix transcriptional regulator [Rhizobium cremeum]